MRLRVEGSMLLIMTWSINLRWVSCQHFPSTISLSSFSRFLVVASVAALEYSPDYSATNLSTVNTSHHLHVAPLQTEQRGLYTPTKRLASFTK
jgi:hypothetical protein